MSYKKGIVEFVKVQTKTSQAGKEYGSMSLLIDKEWYGGFAKKTDTGYAALDKNKTEITKGMEVEFMFETKNGYHSLDNKTLMALSSSNKAPEQPVSNQVTQYPAQQEKVPENAYSDVTDELIDIAANGIAAISALVKFRNKQIPDDIISKLPRVKEHAKKMLK